MFITLLQSQTLKFVLLCKLTSNLAFLIYLTTFFHVIIRVTIWFIG